jgi:plasmid stabilization system protein ParE
MAYLDNLTARAERDLAHLYREINADHSAAALKWYRGFKEAMLSLEEQPHRCRTIYRVLEKQKQVELLHIRHSARRRLKRSDVA